MNRNALNFKGYRIVEAKADESKVKDDTGVCGQCLAHEKNFCSVALFDAAEAFFGGDCQHQDVVYAKAPAA